MSTIYRKNIVCACCGKNEEYAYLASINSFGYCDVDLRQPEGARSTIPYWVTECIIAVM